MTVFTTVLVLVVTAWGVFFMISLPVLAALIRSSQLSRGEVKTGLEPAEASETYSISDGESGLFLADFTNCRAATVRVDSVRGS